MRAAATETSCLGDTSMKCSSSGGTIRNSPLLRAETRSWVNWPLRSISALAWAMTNFSSFKRGEELDLVGHLAR